MSGVPSLGVGVTALKFDAAKLSGSSAASAEDAGDSNTVALLVELPDGKTELLKFRADLTVGYVKVELSKKHGIPFDCQELELAGKGLADPFSLSDYPAIKSSKPSAPVRVVLKRVVPSDGEEDEEEEEDSSAAAASAGKAEAEPTSDYEDESFDE